MWLNLFMLALFRSPVADGDSPSNQQYQLAPDSDESTDPPTLPNDVTLSQMTWIETTRALTQQLGISMNYTAQEIGAGNTYSLSATCLKESKGVGFAVYANGQMFYKTKGLMQHDDNTVWKADIPDAITSKGGSLAIEFKSYTPGGLQFGVKTGLKICEVWLRRRT